MRIIDIDQVQNQSFSVTEDGNRWDFTIKQAVTSMVADISLNDTRILSAQILVAGTPMIPYQYLQGSGNFLILTENDDLPNWERFGVDQIMVYASPADIEAARASA